MYKIEKEVRNDNWELLEEVNTGELFIIQNTSSTPIFYVDLDKEPTEDTRGFILPPEDVLHFKKDTENLYIKKSNDIGFITIGTVKE